LRLCTPEVYARLDEVSHAIASGVDDLLTRDGVPHTIQWAGSMFSVFFRDQPVVNYDDARAQSTEAFAAFFHAMLSHGVHLPPSAFEAWFVSAAHTDEAVQAVLRAADHASRAAAAAFATIEP